MAAEEKTSKVVQILVAALIGAAFAVGVLWQKVNSLEKAKGVPAQVKQPEETAQGQAKADVEPLREIDHVYGDRTARLQLIEYSDFECPFCARFHPTAQQIVEEYQGQVAWVYRHFPLKQIHPKAQKAAEAAECAAKLGEDKAFWGLADKLFEGGEKALEKARMVELAGDIGLDKNEFRACLDSAETIDRVESDYQSGIAAGVQGTPGNFIYDTKTGETKAIPGAQPFESVKSVIDSLLAN